MALTIRNAKATNLNTFKNVITNVPIEQMPKILNPIIKNSVTISELNNTDAIAKNKTMLYMQKIQKIEMQPQKHSL